MPIINPYSAVSSVVNYISSAATSHIYVSSFGTGDDTDMAVTGYDLYPRVFLEQPFNCESTANQLKWNLNLNCLDITKQERTDELDKQNLTLGILNYIIQQIKDDRVYDLDPNINYVSLTEFDDDFTTGWRVEFTLTQALPVDRCSTPYYFTTGSTYFTGNTTLFQNTFVQNGLNIYTGGTPFRPTINYSGSTSGAGSDFFESGSTGLGLQLKYRSNQTFSGNGFTMGSTNTNIGNYSSILNGKNHYSNSQYVFFGSGIRNSANTYSNHSVIINGKYNQTNSYYSTIINGSSNNISAGGAYSVIGNGNSNRIFGNNSFIGTGNGNTGGSSYSVVITGKKNIVNGISSFIGNGIYNSAIGDYSSVLNGRTNVVAGSRSAILNGTRNTNSGPYSCIINGIDNSISGTGAYSIILNGRNNVMKGNYAMIGTGRNHIVHFSATDSCILAGNTNIINSGITSSSILGGNNITALSSNTVYAPHFVSTSLSSTTDSYQRHVYAQADGHLIKGSVVNYTGVLTITSGYTTVLTDRVIRVDATSGNTTVNLITAIGNTGLEYYIKKIDASAKYFIVDGFLAETMDGSLVYSSNTQYNTLHIISNGTNWDILY